MIKHRDYITEILSKRGRLLSESGRVQQFTSRTFLLWDALEYVGDQIDEEHEFKNELLKYFPIGIVACIEGYFRLVYRDLIDYGLPYSDNISNFKDIKFDMDLVAAIHGSRMVSLGELISHLLPCNRYEDINRNMSILIGADFTELVLTTKHSRNTAGSRSSFRDSGFEAKLMSDLKGLFELRHIFCHELAPIQTIDLETAKRCVNGALGLYIATEFMLKTLIPKPTV